MALNIPKMIEQNKIYYATIPNAIDDVHRTESKRAPAARKIALLKSDCHRLPAQLIRLEPRLIAYAEST
ncbi:hypothetical protein K1T71_006522 [Dendrolimus kikuchii]|uniref:Uncharacterized protein n=1 Tax=Dendrolimus kikuchii TaxID=765133 RepID=A0ACC1D120_9NEOP|nr:hypothetical protein K1T71_006522 [Dendrolimus kikuchii]